MAGDEADSFVYVLNLTVFEPVGRLAFERLKHLLIAFPMMRLWNLGLLFRVTVNQLLNKLEGIGGETQFFEGRLRTPSVLFVKTLL